MGIGAIHLYVPIAMNIMIVVNVIVTVPPMNIAKNA